MRIGIIGYGRFGKLWSEQMKKFGGVFVYDKEGGAKKKIGNVLNVDLLFLLVPISEIKNVCREIADKLGKNTIVIDACSVKVKPAEDMLAGLEKSTDHRHPPIVWAGLSFSLWDGWAKNSCLSFESK